MKKNGVLKRCNYLNEWLKTAVYFRDKGQCQICGKDISGLFNTNNELQFDHIVPLAMGGNNDPTNFQLICENCNKKKGARNSETNNFMCTFW